MKTRKVYVLEEGNNGDYVPVKVFSNLEQARQAMREGYLAYAKKNNLTEEDKREGVGWVCKPECDYYAVAVFTKNREWELCLNSAEMEEPENRHPFPCDTLASLWGGECDIADIVSDVYEKTFGKSSVWWTSPADLAAEQKDCLAHRDECEYLTHGFTNEFERWGIGRVAAALKSLYGGDAYNAASYVVKYIEKHPREEI